MNLEKKQRFLIDFTFSVTVFAIIVFAFKFAFAYLAPFIIGFIIAFAVQKPAGFIAKRTRLKKPIYAVILSVAVYLIVALVLVLLISLLFAKADALIEYLIGLGKYSQDILKNINSFLAKFSEKFDADFQNNFKNILTDTVTDFSGRIILSFSNFITDFAKNLPSLSVSAVVTVVAGCYFSKDYDKLKSFFIGFAGKKIYKNTVVIKNITTDSVLKFLFGYLKISFITFFELIVGLFVLKVNHFFITALLIAVVDLLPVLGTGAVLLPWSVITLLNGNCKLGFGLVLLYIVISIVRNFIEPKIIGKQIGINPLFTLISMFVGLKVSGVVGMILFPIILIAVYEFYSKEYSLSQDAQ